MSHAQARLGHSQRCICRALGISRSAVRYEPQPRVDESALTGSIVGLAGQYFRIFFAGCRFTAGPRRSLWHAVTNIAERAFRFSTSNASKTTLCAVVRSKNGVLLPFLCVIATLFHINCLTSDRAVAESHQQRAMNARSTRLCYEWGREPR